MAEEVGDPFVAKAIGKEFAVFEATGVPGDDYVVIGPTWSVESRFDWRRFGLAIGTDWSDPYVKLGVGLTIGPWTLRVKRTSFYGG